MRTEPRPCSACGVSGTLPFITVPLHARAVAIDLCPAHLLGLLGRRLDRSAYLELSRLLHAVGLETGRVFLLHEAFYDRKGKALQPVPEAV
jgi:hypothetical protein